MKDPEKELLEFVNQLWLTPGEYAQKFNISLRTLHWRMKRGKINFVIFKGKRLIRNEEINFTKLQSIV